MRSCVEIFHATNACLTVTLWHSVSQHGYISKLSGLGNKKLRNTFKIPFPRKRVCPIGLLPNMKLLKKCFPQE